MTRVFLSTWGQSDNIGDSILRRGMLRTFQNIDNAELHVHLGRREPGETNDAAYFTALGLRGDEIEYDTSLGWLSRYATYALGGRTMFVLPAGELIFPERSRFYWGWWTLLGALLPTLRGGTAVQVGAGVRMSTVGDSCVDGPRVARSSVRIPMLERYARSKMPVVGWRDPGTCDSFQVGDVVPDWAFGEGPDPQIQGLGPAPRERGIMAVTTRWDRDVLGKDKIRLLRDIAESRGLRIQVYSQVRRDRKTMEELARLLHPGTEPLLFGDESHADWETQVRALHRQSAIVAGDRLHALIIGATEGAIPLAVSNWTTEKVVRTLKPGGFSLPTECPDSINAYLDGMFADEASVSHRITAARTRLDTVRGALRAFADDAAPLRPAPGRSRQTTRNMRSRPQAHSSANRLAG